MTKVLVICDHARRRPSSAGYDEVLAVNQSAPAMNLRLQIWNISHWLLSTLDPIALDLLDIAAYVYHADNSVRRGSVVDVFGAGWRREFHFVVPVRRPRVWSAATTLDRLVELLTYLTGDSFSFSFIKRQRTQEQLAFESFRSDLPAAPSADSVLLFSGGMDSLGAAIHLVAQGGKPVLVSHRSRPDLAALQRRLLVPLRARFSSWQLPHLGIWINRQGRPSVENTQRSRSFLYLALGSLVARQLSLYRVVVGENGITSFNLPRTRQTVGTLASRSTHPHFISLFRELVSDLFDAEFAIETPFVWHTRSEVARLIKDSGSPDLVPLTSSCARTRRTRMHPHCGTCSQCIDRRFALTQAGLDLPDELAAFEKDIFTDTLSAGEEVTQAYSLVQFALEIQDSDLDRFCREYPQVFDVVGTVKGEAENVLERTFELHKRFAHEIHEVMSRMHGEYWDKVFRSELPPTCLLMLTRESPGEIVGGGRTERAEQLGGLISACPTGEAGPYQDIVRQVLSYLFCEYVPPEMALATPIAQARTDLAYEIRDLLFENRASVGFWAEVKNEYSAAGVIADAKNYKDEIDGDVVREFAGKYLKASGVGRFGLVVCRHVPSDVRGAAAAGARLPSAIEEQKEQWRNNSNMVLLLDDDDLREMMSAKSSGGDATDVLRNRIFALKSRI